MSNIFKAGEILKKSETAPIPFEEMKAEAVRRLVKLGYYPPSKEQFRRSGRVMINEPPFGGHFYVDEDEELVEKIKELESENKLVYAVIRARVYGDLMDSILYVEAEKDEWRYFDVDASEGILLSYTFNRDYEQGSEFGYIGFRRSVGAGLLRVS